MKKKEYCRKCGADIPRERKSNYCSNLCNQMPCKFSDYEARIYHDGYNHALEDMKKAVNTK